MAKSRGKAEKRGIYYELRRSCTIVVSLQAFANTVTVVGQDINAAGVDRLHPNSVDHALNECMYC